MDNLNIVNLIQAGMIAIGILGGLLCLTKPKEFRGIAALLFCIALAACINILEESGLTREIYLISPIFIMLFGPATYLAVKLLIEKRLNKSQWWHLLPTLPVLFFTSYTSIIIGIGTLWRLFYALLTVLMLLRYKQSLDEERSDSDDFSLNWLVWILAVTAVFNLLDLIRLNIQHAIPHELNLFGQGVNNAVWLVTAMLIIIKLQVQNNIPKNMHKSSTADIDNDLLVEDYSSIFQELDQLVTSNQWFLKPRLTLSDVSHLTGLQTRDISRAINVVTNKSFNEYINNYRVDFVCSTLDEHPQKTLSDVAVDAGFSSKATFNKVFKQISGTTPSEYKSRKEV
ncbi:helix-turn-helix domain-containing protein [Colwelliaceae bacterium 6471]